MLAAQISISGYDQIDLQIVPAGDYFGLYNEAKLNFAYANEDQTIGARMRLAASFLDPTYSSWKTEMDLAYGWVHFLDHQVRLTAGHLQNYDYTVQSSILPFDSAENPGIYSMANDNWELNDVNGIMLQYNPEQVAGLSVAAVYESDNYAAGWAALYTAAKYENDQFSVIVTSHFNDDFASTRASAMLGVKPVEGLDIRAGIKANMAPTLLLASGRYENGLYTAFGLIDWNWNRLHIRLSPAYVIDSIDSSYNHFAGEGYIAYDITDSLRLVQYGALLDTFNQRGEYGSALGTEVDYKLDKAIFSAGCHYSLSSLNTIVGGCTIYF